MQTLFILRATSACMLSAPLIRPFTTGKTLCVLFEWNSGSERSGTGRRDGEGGQGKITGDYLESNGGKKQDDGKLLLEKRKEKTRKAKRSKTRKGIRWLAPSDGV